MLIEFKLPELGENVEKGDLVRVMVSVGDKIVPDQSVLELETDKATLEVPSSVAGTVKEIHVKAGEQVKVGQLILTVEDSAAAEEKAAEEVTLEPAKVQPAPPAADEEDSAQPAAVPAETVAPPPPAPSAKAQPEAPREAAPASPSVRRYARELGIEINEVPGSGPGGRISADDVTRYAKQLITSPKAAGFAGVAPEPLPDFAKWGEVERQPMRAVRRKTAQHLGAAWIAVPRVTQYDKADITRLEKLRASFAPTVEAAGGKLTLTAMALKVVAFALKSFPQFAASIDMEREEIIYKKYCHIGVAIDTDRGLLVPVIRDVDRKNILQLSVELTELARKARDRKLGREEMEGGVFSISNLGGIGGTAFSPIVNTPEVAILGISRSTTEAVYTNGQFEPRLMLPLSLSYDHRLIDGADGARFLRWVVEACEQPFRLLLKG